MRSPKFFRGIAFVAAAVCFSLVLCFAIMAWSEPSQTPPGGNVAAPINTGGNLQTKSGDLKIGGGLKISSDGTAFALKTDAGADKFTVGQDGNAVASAQLTAPNICFGTGCRAKWIAGTCDGDGNYMKGIDAAGNVICSGAMPCTHKSCIAGEDCGTVDNGNCGGTTDCGKCSGGKTCVKGQCLLCGSCEVEDGCGITKVNNCGQTIQCGCQIAVGIYVGKCGAGGCMGAVKTGVPGNYNIAKRKCGGQLLRKCTIFDQSQFVF